MNVSCLHCAKTFSVDKVNSVKASDALCQSVRSGEYFKWTCPECGREAVLNFPFLYHDEENGVLILLTQTPVKGEGVPQGYRGRVVGTPGELVEKLNIFEAGLDDVVVEMCKYVTLNELTKDVTLRFFRIDGADSQIIFTYPENGQMQMLAVGLNVYEDCVGIVQRNPAMMEDAASLVCVDQDWIARFFA